MVKKDPSVSVFCIIKNEAQFIGLSVMSFLDYVDELCYLVSPSNDATMDILTHIKERYDKHDCVKIFPYEDFNVQNQSAYELANTISIQHCTSDYCFWVHADMLCTNPWDIKDEIIANGYADRYEVNVQSIAGENYDQEFEDGRNPWWGNIIKNDYHPEYRGAYGSKDEDFFHTDLVDESERRHWSRITDAPFSVARSAVKILHFCECRPYEERKRKMIKVLRTAYAGIQDDQVADVVATHPRITLQDGMFGGHNFKLKKREHISNIEKRYRKEFDEIRSRKEVLRDSPSL